MGKRENKSIKVICAWCGKVIQEGDGDISHGICRECFEIQKKIIKMEKSRENNNGRK